MNKIQLAEIGHGKETALTALAEAETSLDFSQAGVHLSPSHPQVPTFVNELGNLIDRNRVSAKLISYALPPDPVFVNVVPVDRSFKESKVSEYLQWELSQYFPEVSAKEFIINSHQLPSETKFADNMFMVAVRRGMVGFLQKVTAYLDLQINIVDIDHFSAEKALKFNYPEIRGHTVAFFGIRYGCVDASLVRDGELVDYRTFCGEFPDDLGKAVSNYLKYLKQVDGIESPRVLFLAGSEIPPDIVKRLKKQTEIQVIVFNALRKLPISGRIYQPFVKNNARFAAAIGLALRTH